MRTEASGRSQKPWHSVRHKQTSTHEKNPAAQLKQQWVPYELISPHLKRAIIASEDAKFVDHEGFDWDGIQKALEKNQRRGRTVAGGSTISQQLAKNLFLTPTKSYFRKAEEAEGEGGRPESPLEHLVQEFEHFAKDEPLEASSASFDTDINAESKTFVSSLVLL